MSATLLSAWEDTVRAAPGAVALIDAATGRTWTRAELDASGRAWRDQHGAKLARQTVVLALPGGAEWWRVFLGLLHADAVVAPLDPGEPLAAQRTTAAAIRAAWLWRDEGLEQIAPRPRRARDERRLLKLTSGSTGTPRALAFTDAQLLADGRQVCAGMGIRGNDRNLGLIPLGHSYGLGNLVVPLLAQGTAMVTGVAGLPHAIAEAARHWRPTVFPAVPALLRALALADIAPAHLASLRTVISAGAPLAPEIATAFHQRFGKKIHSFYGSSETGGITYDHTGDAALTGKSVGPPLPGVRLTPDRSGTVVIESPAVFTIGNRTPGAHRPKDHLAFTADGEVVLLGRAGRTVKIAGRRLDLAEVERALRALPGVREAFVAPHAERAESLAAVVAGDTPAEALRTALRERIAAWKIPRKIVVTAAFPLTARGKADTARLRAMLEA
ncbi:MAG: class I adenylate-forming enzyme family protein [Opitutaceae bacterium]|nr:class I adenylate-forming enzyme family protein [Opitutaceae bacterium]